MTVQTGTATSVFAESNSEFYFFRVTKWRTM